MSGIYIHIPFCQKRCSYCDFFSDTQIEISNKLINCLIKEINLRKDYLPDIKINTVYFGGGTPSLLKKEDFERIFEAIYKIYTFDKDAEITFEANPDDLTEEYLSSVSPLPFNRISIGIQSFDDNYLKLLNRRHTKEQAINAVLNAQKSGFNNISIDLMFGLPSQTLENWEQQLDRALNLNIQHISAYGLTYEEGTVLWKLKNTNKIKPVDEEISAGMYRMLLNKTKQKGFEAYEISNFSLPGYHSRHNSSYWQQKPYIGIGPSAHSYDGKSRQWNINSISEYIKNISENHIPFEKEILSLSEQYNDYVMVSLRTAKGINLDELEEKYGPEMKTYCLQNIKTFIDTEKVEYKDNVIRLNTDGLLISDHIMAQLMKV